MKTLDLARKAAQLGDTKSAQTAYSMALSQEKLLPEEELEAAVYIFASKGSYRVAYTTFVSLYNRGFFKEELMKIMTESFYLPNIKNQKRCYVNNCKQLSKYPYLFRKDFPEFEDLKIKFFPFNEKGFVPYLVEEDRFSAYIDFNDTIIDRYFFQDLDRPVLADDVFSQYQLEYLYDTVRRSEWVGYENHIYLHYTRWDLFCAYLQCIYFRNLLTDKKFVFLIEDEISQYPIDFSARFGVDYSQFPVRPVGIREVKRLIWHTQLSSHNGGDFFNEIFFGHPNLLVFESIMFDTLKEITDTLLQATRKKDKSTPILYKLSQLHDPTLKDCLVAFALYSDQMKQSVDPKQRIVPALFFQPHFANLKYRVSIVEVNSRWTILHSNEYEKIRTSPIFRDFKYIKTFTPMRRITSSYAATVRFMREWRKDEDEKEKRKEVMTDELLERLLNRSFMVDQWDRLYRDSILVRFEDGKLNPTATFTALAKFLDIPYTESMTYCSGRTGLNPESLKGNDRGFDPAAIYRTYDNFANDEERAFLEYFFRDAYSYYGYEFNYYEGEPVNEEWVENKIDHFTCIDGHIAQSWKEVLGDNFRITPKDIMNPNSFFGKLSESELERFSDGGIEPLLAYYHKERCRFSQYLMRGLYFVNKQGQPLHMMKKLELDPALLEQPLYH